MDILDCPVYVVLAESPEPMPIERVELQNCDMILGLVVSLAAAGKLGESHTDLHPS
jgi:hypothetical protein